MSKVMKTMDGNEAAAWVSYAFTEVAGIYPITPSSPMADITDVWASQGKKNLFGMPVKVVEMQSEAGAAGTVHGSLQAGALTTTYTASQGLLLKVPDMYRIAGQLLPGVIHVAARALAAGSLSIFGDHQDIYATRQTGFAILASGSVQEVMDIGGIAHLAAIKGRVPFLHFFDGFRTSHEVQKIEVMDYAHFDRLLDYDAVREFRKNALNPEFAKTRGTAQNDDIYFQTRESINKFYDAVPEVVENYMDEISKITGRTYKPFVYYGDPEATRVIIAMGSVTQCLEEVVDYLNAKGEKVGVVKVHLYRPFSVKHLFAVMPKSVEKIAVLDRTKEPGSLAEPLYLDIKAAYYGKENAPLIVGGRYGLAGKDTNPAQMISVFRNLGEAAPKDNFTVGIVDDVTHLSLEIKPEDRVILANEDIRACLFYGLGADGTVGANKNSIKIIGDKTDLYAQAYFAYDSKKSGGYTRSHLRFSKNPIKSTYLISRPSFVACSVAAYLDIYDVIDGIAPKGTFLLNSIWDEAETIKRIPNKVKKILAEREVNFYIINATKLAAELGLGNRTNTIMQSAFFKLADVIPFEDAQKYMKEQAKKTYGKKGDAIVEMNYKAIDTGANGLVKVTVDPAWAKLDADDHKEEKYVGDAFIENIVKPVNAARGESLPVSVFNGWEDGSFPAGTTKYEKRGVGVNVPKWIKENCIQCNACAFACPHAVIRPFLLTDEELANSPIDIKDRVIKAKGKGTEGLSYKIQISDLDCTGCELCAVACPTKEKSLVMVPLQEELENKEQEIADYLFAEATYKDDIFNTDTVKGIGLSKPYFEFHAACPGCGETPYVTLLSRLFGDHLLQANATGCSSIYGASAPSMPYIANKDGNGIAWGNSLFEDGAEFGMGMLVANETLRHRIENLMLESMDKVPNSLKALFKDWMEFKNSHEKTKELRDKMLPILEENKNIKEIAELLELKHYITKKSHWIVGGDGWAYDIGYGGVDHVLASGENINIMVLDTEVYSNTGGQSSKSSRVGSIAQFTASGKPVQKKDLGFISMTYENIFVAQINSNAAPAHAIKAMKMAEEYDGPSLIIAYSPCIAHGIKGGLSASGAQAEKATKVGYWPTYTFDPRLIKEGKNPLKIVSKEPEWDKYFDFLEGEVRYNALKKLNPEEASALFEKNKYFAQRRWAYLKRMEAADFSLKS